MESKFLCIDLKSFYASVECVERGLDSMTAKLVVADPERTDKTICLAVSPALKALGVKNRCRLFEIPDNLEYIIAPPRMKLYIDYSARVYSVYLKYVSENDIHVYSVDEAFLDIAPYLSLYGCCARKLAKTIIEDIYKCTGIRATCGIGTNLYLAKIALDITAKHAKDFIGELDEESFKATMWEHRPLTDFWRIGAGTASRLERRGIFTMRDIAQTDERVLYSLFGKDAELLIDHAFGRETATMADIKSYCPQSRSVTSGQVLMRDYTYSECEIIVKEMADALCIDLAEKKLVAESITLHIGYSGSEDAAHGTVSLGSKTNLSLIIIPAAVALYHKITDRNTPIRRLYINANRVAEEGSAQMSLFESEEEEECKAVCDAVLHIKHKYGKNAILKGINFEDASTMRERNRQIGGHKSGE